MKRQAFSWTEWGRLGAVELAERVRRKDVTADEVAQQAIAAARALDPRLGAAVEVFDAPAAPTDAQRRSTGDGAGLMAGVPMFLKDLGSSVAGALRENGSALHRNERVARTDPLPREWLHEGARIIGRATTAELGMAYDTSTVYRGLQVTRNPWNPSLTAGGSSGGSAALVAAGVVPLAHATDGAGSIRQPAALNGLVGLKVSRGRLPLPWHVNELINTSMVEGVIARSLHDTALALDAATARPPPLGKHYASSFGLAPTRALAALAEKQRATLRVGVTTHAFGRDGACEATRADRVHDVARQLARAGHRVEDIPAAALPDWPVLWRSFETFWAGMRAASWQVAHAEAPPDRLAMLSPMVRAYWEASGRYGKQQVMRYLADNVHIGLAFGRLFERYDVLLLPVVPYATPQANGVLSAAVEQDFEAFVRRFLDAGRYTIPANEAGFPALALPAGMDASGMPMGVQLYGRWGGEIELLQAGAALQEVVAPLQAHPQVHVSTLSDLGPPSALSPK